MKKYQRINDNLGTEVDLKVTYKLAEGLTPLAYCLMPRQVSPLIFCSLFPDLLYLSSPS